LRASLHRRAHSKGGRSQLRIRAGQSSLVRSLSQPGSSDQSTGTQRERSRSKAPEGVAEMAPPGVGAEPGAFAGTSTGARSGASRGRGVEEQAASTPRMSAGHARRAALRDDKAMWVILLEALGAMALLILIVWWTMFSGRKGGERRSEDR